MSSPVSISEILINLFNYFKEDLFPIYICREGNNVILEYLGKPISIKKDTGMYFKMPFLHTIKTVDVRKQVMFMHAHSFREKEVLMIPYNISIDASIEYRITNPLVIYSIEDIDNYIKNKVHIFLQKSSGDELNDLQKALNKEFGGKDVIEQGLSGMGNLLNFVFKGFKKKKKGLKIKNFEEGILIEKVVLSSYDNLISHRATE